jgi:two-component system sensor histidine kinase KdpD
LEQINVAATRLNDQVENLLSMSRLETGMLQLKKSWYDVNEIITDCINNTAKILQQEIHYLHDENLPLFNVDAGLLKQVIQNILNNAIAYTPLETTINIVALLLEKDILQITIVDNGKGVSNNELPFLFDKFYRVPHTATGGTGLGLSIVKGYVEAHNGKVNAFHNNPSGLVIEISIPVETSYINKLKNE